MTTSSCITSLPWTFAFHGNLVMWPYSNLLKSPSIVTSYATFTVIGSKILCNSFLSGKKLLIIGIHMKVGWCHLFKYKLLNKKSDIFSDVVLETIFSWGNMNKSTIASSRVCWHLLLQPFFGKSVQQYSFIVTLPQLSLKLRCWPTQNFIEVYLLTYSK